MAKLGELVGLSPLETVAMTDFQANVLAIHAQEALFKEAMRNPGMMGPQMTRAVRARTTRVIRSMREAGAAGGDDGLGPPPEG